MKPFEGVHYFPFLSYVYTVHDLICGPKCMVIVNEVLCKIRFSIIIFVISEMFFESRMKGTAGLSGIFLVTVFTNQLVYTTLLEFVLVSVMVFVVLFGE